MNIQELPPDMRRETLFQLPPKDVINYCTSSKEILEQCNDHPFLKNYVYNNFYGLDIDSIKQPTSLWDKFVLVSRLVQEVTTKHLYPSNIAYKEKNGNSTVDKILAEAISSGSPELLKILLYLVSENVRPFDRYNDVLMNTFVSLLHRASLETVRSGTDPFIRTILLYYHPQKSTFFDGVFTQSVRDNDVDMFNKSLVYVSDMFHGYHAADIFNRPQMLAVINDYISLLSQHQVRLSDITEESIRSNPKIAAVAPYYANLRA